MVDGLTGGCQCGAVRYALTTAPTTYYACHCGECRRQSGSAFGLSLILPVGGVRVDGRLAARARPGSSGPVEGRFCPVCGCRVLHDGGADAVSLKAGTLDDPFAFRLAGRIWTAGAPDWALGGEDLLVYPGAPPGLGPLAARFRALNGL